MQTSDRPHLRIVVPAFNEAARVGACVDRATAYLAAQNYASELRVVSDGSTDATAQIAREAGRERVQVIETLIHEVERFLAAITAGFDVVVGSRALSDSDVRVQQAWWRQSMGRTFKQIARAAIGVEMRDTQCGFKSFQRDAARAIFSRAQIDRYAFNVELLRIAQRLRLRVGELPGIWADDSHSKVHPICDSLRMLADLAAIRRHEVRGAYATSPAIGASDQGGPA